VNREGVLLLGGTGFIVRALAGRLEREGIAAHILGRHNVERLADILPLCGTVIHLASTTTPGSSASHPELESDNLTLTLHLLKLLQSQPETHLIFFSSGGTVYGRLVSTSSEAFLYGSVGQPNYAAAKAGIVAMTMGAAQALVKYGVTANVIMPRARTDMTMGGGTAAMFEKPAEGFDHFDPAHVAPFVGYLASPRSQRITGYVFVVWGKQVTVVEGPKLGKVFENDGHWTVDQLDAAMSPHFEKLRPIMDGFAIIPTA